MIEVHVAEINIWLKEHNVKDKYNVKIINDPLTGKRIALYQIYTNGTQEVVVQGRTKEKILGYLSLNNKK